jgi:hypothetical protein
MDKRSREDEDADADGKNADISIATILGDDT